MEETKKSAPLMLGFDPQDHLTEFEKVATERAHAKADFEFKKEYKKTALALAIEYARLEEPDLPANKLEPRALCSADYVKFIESYKASMLEFERLDARYWSLEKQIDYEKGLMDLLRSQMYQDR